MSYGSEIPFPGAGGGQEGEMPHTPYKEESDSEEEEEEIAAVEMILETYFMHCDNTYNKLQTLCEHSFLLSLLCSCNEAHKRQSRSQIRFLNLASELVRLELPQVRLRKMEWAVRSHPDNKRQTCCLH